MSLNNDSMTSLKEMWKQNSPEQSHENSYAMENHLQQNGEHNIEGHSEDSDHTHREKDLAVHDKMTVIEQTFKTLGGDLEDVKNLMFKLQKILKSGDEEDEYAFGRKQCFSEESSSEVSVIEEKEGRDDVTRLQQEDNPTCSESLRESSAESLESSSQYSGLVADIEVLKDKLVSLKRNLSQ